MNKLNSTEAHVGDDVDVDRSSHHHTLGLGPTQAAPGNAGFWPGDLKVSAAINPPPGWLVCDGTVLKRDQYPALFKAISTNFNIGGEAGTDFRLPDLRDRLPVGKSGTKALGSTGGADTVNLTTGQLPSHTHGPGTLGTNSAGSHTHVIDQAGGAGAAATLVKGSALTSSGSGAVQSAGAHTHSVNTGVTAATGSGDAVNVQNKYQALNYFIKT